MLYLYVTEENGCAAAMGVCCPSWYSKLCTFMSAVALAYGHVKRQRNRVSSSDEYTSAGTREGFGRIKYPFSRRTPSTAAEANCLAVDKQPQQPQ